MTPRQILRWVSFASILLGAIGGDCVQAAPKEGASKMEVSRGTLVSIEYTLRLKDDEVVDTNVGADPLTYTQGAQQIVPGLEKALEGMTIGEQKYVTVAPEEGYGPVNSEAYLEVAKEQIPPEALKEGAQLQGQDRDGRPIRAQVHEIKDKTVVLDFNHPLAGETLFFDVKILDVKLSSTK
jgi:FKBP-type peptidyl-prolyl cis-trans isomerase SlyD